MESVKAVRESLQIPVVGVVLEADLVVRGIRAGSSAVRARQRQQPAQPE
jgi:septum formation inhibitor-activating ATPase MinD